MKPYYQDDYITIYHGDCLEILPGLVGIDSLITDPPYGVDFDTDYTRFSGFTRRASDAPSNTHQAIKGDNKPFDPGPFLKYLHVVLFGANNYALPPGSLLIWDKRTIGGFKGVMADAEVAWMNSGHGVYIFQHTWDGFNRASERSTAYHPSQKPVILLSWIIQKARPGGLICDPYAGSGSTLVAAKQLGLKAIGIEIVESYCEIAARRIEQTGVMLPAMQAVEAKPEQLPLDV